MKLYNFAKSGGVLQKKNDCIVALQIETVSLKADILDLQVDHGKLILYIESIKNQQKEAIKERLEAQREHLSIRHTAILTNYSEKLKLKYEQNFNESFDHFKSENLSLKSEVDRLSLELDLARSAIRSAGTRRPVYSPGKYTDNG